MVRLGWPRPLPLLLDRLVDVAESWNPGPLVFVRVGSPQDPVANLSCRDVMVPGGLRPREGVHLPPEGVLTVGRVVVIAGVPGVGLLRSEGPGDRGVAGFVSFAPVAAQEHLAACR